LRSIIAFLEVRAASVTVIVGEAEKIIRTKMALKTNATGNAQSILIGIITVRTLRNSNIGSARLGALGSTRSR
jgi:hypothetical protein